MSIFQRINENKIEYVDKYEYDPEFIFINLQTYEEILLASESVLSIPETISGSILIPANEMQRPFIFLSEDDLQIGLNNYKVPREDVIFRKYMNTQRKPIDNPNIRRIGNERMQTNFIIPYQAIESYKQYLSNKNLQS